MTNLPAPPSFAQRVSPGSIAVQPRIPNEAHEALIMQAFASLYAQGISSREIGEVLARALVNQHEEDGSFDPIGAAKLEVTGVFASITDEKDPHRKGEYLKGRSGANTTGNRNCF